VFEQRSTSPGDKLHDGLVGLHLGEHVADDDGIALLLLPFDQAPLFHGGREGFHYDLRSHP
jgi:hypothetical protein